MPLWATLIPLNQIDKRSRSAGSPALPTAMTTRPQLASSPPIAVFTSGEFAIDIATRRADLAEAAPSTITSTSLRAPSPSRATCSANDFSTLSSASPKPLSRGSAAREITGAPLAAAAPVAKASSVSEVEVSPSIVTALKLSRTPFASSTCKAGAAMGASVNTNDSRVAISGAIMPAPLAMPQIVTTASPSLAVAVAPFGKVSVVMMALAAASKLPGFAAATRPSITRSKAWASSGSPITPVEARSTSPGLQLAAWAVLAAVYRVASRPVRPVKALAFPELTTSPRALPALILSRHQSTAADGHFDLVNTPATVVPLSNSANRTSVRPLYRMPAAAVAMRTPAICGMSGKFEGASGDTAGAMGASKVGSRWFERRLSSHAPLEVRRRGSNGASAPCNGAEAFLDEVASITVVARLDRAIRYPQSVVTGLPGQAGQRQPPPTP